MNSPDNISESLETIFCVKILKFFDADADPDPGSGKLFDPRSGIRVGKNSDPGSGINIPDAQHWRYKLYRCPVPVLCHTYIDTVPLSFPTHIVLRLNKIFRIRIHLARIRIQSFYLSADTGPNTAFDLL
jgi:hypothetical protein